MLGQLVIDRIAALGMQLPPTEGGV
jgi:hypothetical protein